MPILRWPSLMLVLVPLASCSGSAAPAPAQPPVVVTPVTIPTQQPIPLNLPANLAVAFVTDANGANDQGVNALAISGLQAALRQGKAADATVVASADPADYMANLTSAAQKAALVIAMGSDMRDAVTTAAKSTPRVAFALLAAPSGAQPAVANLHWLTFDMRPGAYIGRRPSRRSKPLSRHRFRWR